MNDYSKVILLTICSLGILLSSFSLGKSLGEMKGIRDAAKAALENPLPAFWKHALIDAKAEKEKKELD